jgi:hypothetical protein
MDECTTGSLLSSAPCTAETPLTGFTTCSACLSFVCTEGIFKKDFSLLQRSPAPLRWWMLCGLPRAPLGRLNHLLIFARTPRRLYNCAHFTATATHSIEVSRAGGGGAASSMGKTAIIWFRKVSWGVLNVGMY